MAALVSVVIPTYNCATLLGQAINAVLAQSFKDFEIIVIDDHSTDNTKEVIDSFAGQGLRYSLSHKTRNIAASRNRGIFLAQGKYVAFLDSDDTWFPIKLERVMQVFCEAPEIDLVCHDEEKYDLAANRALKILRSGPYTNYEDLLFKRNCIATSAVVVKKEKLMAAGLFDESPEFITTEDYELWLRLAKICRIHYLRECLGTYNIHQHASTQKLEFHYLNTINVVEHHYRLLPQKTSWTRWRFQMRKAAIWRRLGRELLRGGQYQQGWKYLLASLAANPVFWKTWVDLATLGLLSRGRPLKNDG
jgi:glycosyltransferase involved in cell wall biosynthesis